MNNLSEMYSKNNIQKRLVRFMLPALLTCMVVWVFEGKGESLFWTMIKSDYAPGSYYPVLMLQLVFIFPLLYQMLKNNRNIWIVLCICVILELISSLIQLDNKIYRLLIHRYIMYIASGIIIFQRKKISYKALVFMLITGCIYIFAVKEGYKPYIFRNWSNTATPVVLFVLPIMYIIIDKFSLFYIKGIVGKILEIMGSASYHILFAHIITLKIWKSIGNDSFVNVIGICVVLAVILGVIFWKIEDKFVMKWF